MIAQLQHTTAQHVAEHKNVELQSVRTWSLNELGRAETAWPLQVRTAVGDKWQDVEYLNHTSLKTYMPYMMGGGYVLSADLARVILGINHQVRLGSRQGSRLACIAQRNQFGLTGDLSCR